MKLDDLKKIYETKKKEHGTQAYRHVANILEEAKEQHKKDFSGGDFGQSWRASKGKNLERLIKYIIEDEVQSMNLAIIDGNTLERTLCHNLPKELNSVKRGLLIDYGEYGCHLPDADIIIYNPETYKPVAIISIKVTLRERIAQTGYWKLKLSADEKTEHVKVYFLTPDEDNDLMTIKDAKKGRAIVEKDTDGGYVMSETNIEESDKIKMFDKFIDDLKKLRGD